jgi:hypothetical protein
MNFVTQRRKGAKGLHPAAKPLFIPVQIRTASRLALHLCAFAPLRDKSLLLGTST